MTDSAARCQCVVTVTHNSVTTKIECPNPVSGATHDYCDPCTTAGSPCWRGWDE